MALKLSFTDPDTQAFYPDAYLRIDNIGLNQLNSPGSTLSLGIYATQAAANNNAVPIKRINYVLNDDQTSTLRAEGLTLLYAIVAADPQFAQAIAV